MNKRKRTRADFAGFVARNNTPEGIAKRKELREALERKVQAKKRSSYETSNRKQQTEIKRNLIIEAKDKPCTHCKVKYPIYVMDLHHAHPGNKEFSFGWINLKDYTLEKIEEELVKCIPLCANCHRIVTYGPKK